MFFIIPKLISTTVFVGQTKLGLGTGTVGYWTRRNTFVVKASDAACVAARSVSFARDFPRFPHQTRRVPRLAHRTCCIVARLGAIPDAVRFRSRMLLSHSKHGVGSARALSLRQRAWKLPHPSRRRANRLRWIPTNRCAKNKTA